MGNLIGILSTVILVSTVCTLIFAVGAYVVSRKKRTGVGDGDESSIPGEVVGDTFPQSTSRSTSVFKRVQPTIGGGDTGASQNSTIDDDYQWK